MLKMNEKLIAALEEIGAVLSPSVADIVGQTTDPVAQACLLVGHAMNIKFICPPELADLSDDEEKLELICRVSQIQKRKMYLNDGWWSEDHGPFLGFWGEEGKPAAFLNPMKYKLVDKANSKVVTSSLAKEISDTAYMFYAPFDFKVKIGSQVFRHLLGQHLRRWAVAIPTIVVGIIYALFPSIATKLLFQYAIPQNSPSLIIYLSLGLVFSAIGLSLYHFLKGLFFLNLKGHFSNFLRGAFWDHLLRLPAQFFRRFAIGDLFSRVFALDLIDKLTDINFLNPLFMGVFAALYFIAMFYFVPFLSLIVLLISVVGIGISVACGYFRAAIIRKSLDLEGTIQGLLLHFIRGIGNLRVARAETNAFSLWASMFAKNQSYRLKAKHIQNIASISNHFLPLFSIFFVYLAILEWIPIKEIALSDFLAFNIAFGSFCLTIYPFADSLIELMDIGLLWERVKLIFQEPTEESIYRPNPIKLTGEIKLDDVIFSYHPKVAPILNGISLAIKPGEFIGIAGKSGSGKSTLLQLLLGFEKPQSGVIFFDEQDLQSLEIRNIRGQIGAAFQGLGMIPGGIMQILFAGKKVPKEQIAEALEFANLSQDIQSFPMKLATPTHTLSGSQKERLALCRAVLGNPSILLLDEPTSSLDGLSRQRVNRNIKNQKATRLLATTQLDNLRKTDRIYVLDQGKIVQVGTFDELAKMPGLFFEILSKQKA